MWSKTVVILVMVTLLAGGSSWAAPVAKQEDAKQGHQHMSYSPWSTSYPGMNYGSSYPGMNYGSSYPGMNYGTSYPGVNYGVGPAFSPVYPSYQGYGFGSGYMRPGGMGYVPQYPYFQHSGPGMYSVESKRPKGQHLTSIPDSSA